MFTEMQNGQDVSSPQAHSMNVFSREEQQIWQISRLAHSSQNSVRWFCLQSMRSLPASSPCSKFTLSDPFQTHLQLFHTWKLWTTYSLAFPGALWREYLLKFTIRGNTASFWYTYSGLVSGIMSLFWGVPFKTWQPWIRILPHTHLKNIVPKHPRSELLIWDIFLLTSSCANKIYSHEPLWCVCGKAGNSALITCKKKKNWLWCLLFIKVTLFTCRILL